MTYYKGNIELYSSIKKWNIKIGHIHSLKSCEPSLTSLEKLENSNFSPLTTIAPTLIVNHNTVNNILNENSYALKVLNNVFEKQNIIFTKSLMIPIIFEIITDQNGISYGKEILSNLIFPIATSKNTVKTYYNYTDNYGKDGDWLVYGDCYIIINYKIYDTNLEKLESFIYNAKVADANEVEKYKTMYQKGLFHNQKLDSYINKLQLLYNKNVFKPDVSFEPKKEIPRIKQSNETSIMENIEYLLQKLKDIDIDSYHIYQTKYEELLNNEDKTLTNNPLCLSSLSLLEGKIEAIISFGKKKASNLLQYFNELKEEYLINFLTNNKEKTSLTLDEINKLNETFLKIKSEYKLFEQRNILRNIALIYLLEVKENINNIDIDKLKQSYFADNLKSIVICIKSLQELNIIESVMIDLEDNFDVNTVIKIIKKIKFNKSNNEDIKKLVKKI